MRYLKGCLMLMICGIFCISAKSQESKELSNDTLKSISDLYNESDSAALVQSLIELSDLEKSRENYSQSYDCLWDALAMAENLKYDLQLYEIHRRLGMLFSIFEKDAEALSHKKFALNLCKELIDDSVLDTSKLLSGYFSIALYYRKTMNYGLALTYFDSCLVVHNSLENGGMENGFILSELGYIRMAQGDFAQAESLMTRAIEMFTPVDDSYLVFTYAYLGELKERQSFYSEAIENYLQCLLTIDRLNSHVDLRPDILDRLSNLYHLQNDHSMAYLYLRESKNINDTLFNVKGISHLFNMRNKYQEDIELKDRQLRSNELLLARKSQSNLQLRILISILLLAIAVIGFFTVFYFQKKKHNNEKREMELKNRHENEKAQEILDIKNKELTAYTLQLIDKDSIVNDLYQYIRSHIDDHSDINHLKQSISGNNKKMWDEFHIRFVAVNADFYANLRAKFPKLTPTERKYCALIKLKFSSKDMAQLLSVSLESVHITRHRLRKKMSLAQGVNLSNHIAEI